MKITVIGKGGLYNAEFFYVKALRALGHDVRFIDQYEGVSRPTLTRFLVTRFSSARLILRRLEVNKIRDLGNPDLVLVFKGELLDDAFLRLLRDYNAYLFFPDTFRFRMLLKNRLQRFNGIIVTTPFTEYFKRLGAKRVITTSWACDPEVHRPIDVEKIYDVTFVGTFYPNRWSILRKVKPKPHVFGDFWLFQAGVLHKSVYGEDYIRTINQSKINVNVHHPADIKAEAPNMRTFEVAGSGGFLITERMNVLNTFFKRIETYATVDELNEKIKYYLQNEKQRTEIGMALREECERRHTYYIRIQDLLRQLY